MKLGFRKPSMSKRFGAKLSLKRNLGLKLPKGMGAISNPKKAIYNKVYSKTTFDLRSKKTGRLTRLQ
jgi:hypothetical protein